MCVYVCVCVCVCLYGVHIILCHDDVGVGGV